MAPTDRAQQIAQAEELLADRLTRIGFTRGLFFGRYVDGQLPPYPDRHCDADVNRLVADLGAFCRDHVDPVAIDRQEEIPRAVIDGLGRLGVLGACLPKAVGGLGLGQAAYCQLMEVLGGHCASTALFVNAHHSIGPRALVLFGTPAQQQRWLPPLASGQWLSAFALTEPEAGSDAANVQTTARPTPDGRGFVLDGEKRWITNGGIAQVLTVMARTPVPGSADAKITAFVVTPDLPGFEVPEARMSKCGVRGTVTSRLAFREMFVPRENVLGSLGQGLKIALTVLDFGRTTFGASCTGAAKFCLTRAAAHAATRVQFGQPIGQFELLQQKLAFMAAGAYAMEAMTYQTAALIDAGAADYMLETALLKVFATETLWRIVNDTIQVFGGRAYFTDEPYERLLRDARINTIGEGANDVLRAFAALVGLRDVGLDLQGVLAAARQPLRNLGRLGQFAGRKLESWFSSPHVEVSRAPLEPAADELGRLAGEFGGHVERLLRTHREAIVDRQHCLGRVADAAAELYASACVLRRLDCQWTSGSEDAATRQRDRAAGLYYLATAARRIRRNLDELWSNDDDQTNRLAALVLARAER